MELINRQIKLLEDKMSEMNTKIEDLEIKNTNTKTSLEKILNNNVPNTIIFNYNDFAYSNDNNNYMNFVELYFGIVSEFSKLSSNCIKFIMENYLLYHKNSASYIDVILSKFFSTPDIKNIVHMLEIIKLINVEYIEFFYQYAKIHSVNLDLDANKIAIHICQQHDVLGENGKTVAIFKKYIDDSKNEISFKELFNIIFYNSYINVENKFCFIADILDLYEYDDIFEEITHENVDYVIDNNKYRYSNIILIELFNRGYFNNKLEEYFVTGNKYLSILCNVIDIININTIDLFIQKLPELNYSANDDYLFQRVCENQRFDIAYLLKKYFPDIDHHVSDDKWINYVYSDPKFSEWMKNDCPIMKKMIKSAN